MNRLDASSLELRRVVEAALQVFAKKMLKQVFSAYPGISTKGGRGFDSHESSKMGTYLIQQAPLSVDDPAKRGSTVHEQTSLAKRGEDAMLFYGSKDASKEIPGNVTKEYWGPLAESGYLILVAIDAGGWSKGPGGKILKRGKVASTHQIAALGSSLLKAASDAVKAAPQEYESPSKRIRTFSNLIKDVGTISRHAFHTQLTCQNAGFSHL